MADQSSSPLGLPPSVWIVLVVGLAGAFAASQRPFQDVRPLDSAAPAYRHATAEDQDVEARQWQDPFSAVAIARRAHPAGQAKADEKGSPAAQQPGENQHTIARLVADLHDRPGTAVLVLGAMVSGAPYADDIETRRRTRYAVLAGLSAEGYVPDDNEHVGYVTLPAFPAGTLRVHDIAAYEWLHRESPVDVARGARVLLLWLDQDGFRGAPLGRFSALVDSIAPREAVSSPITEVILGPADSDGLKAMSGELDQDPGKACSFLAAPMRDISIYSPRATALDWWIVSDQVRQRYPDSQNDPHADHFNDRCGHVHLYRTVASDFTVARSLFRELKYRGIQSVGEIALVTERDTLYARLMSRYFNGCAGSEPIKDEFTVAGESDKSRPQCFTYLRGLDGLVPPTPDSSGSSQVAPDAKPAAGDAAARAPVAGDSSAGQGQLDYLRRLTASLASRRDDPTCGWLARKLNLGDQSEAEHRCGKRIKAIGVVGSDIYDKLLVLQALRRAFPRYIFFSTDLDARLTDEQNLPWTRELVVGSSLGLSLRPELQGTVPPFRDSYQTATYYSTMQAVRRFLAADAGSSTSLDLSWTRRPQVFEIGRTQAFDISADRDVASRCDSVHSCRSIAAWREPPIWSTGSVSSYLIVACIVMVMTMLVVGAAMGATWTVQLVTRTRTSPANPAPPGSSLLLAAVVLAITALLSVWAWASLVHALTNDGKRIPTPIFSGASHWAASMIEALSILVVVTLVIRGQRKLQVNAHEIFKEFNFPNSGEVLASAYREWLRSSPSHRRWKERLWFPIRRLSGNDKGYLPKPRGGGKGSQSKARANAAKEPPAKESPAKENRLSALELLIGQYLYRGRWRARLERVAIATFVASCVLLILEYILMVFEFNLGISLVNGFALIDTHYVERGIEDAISLINLFAVQFLIFWAADAMLLTRSFVLALAQDRPQWPDNVLQEQSAALGLPDVWTSMWLDLRLIARRTARVANLIWYPSIMIAAMAVAALTVQFGEFGFASNPIALVISAGFVVGAAVLLRRVAEAWRSDVLFKLDDARLLALGSPGGAAGQLAQLDRLAERVRSLSDGAFAPYAQQPMVRAVLVPALTYGATAGLEYLHIGS